MDSSLLRLLPHAQHMSRRPSCTAVDTNDSITSAGPTLYPNAMAPIARPLAHDLHYSALLRFTSRSAFLLWLDCEGVCHDYSLTHSRPRDHPPLPVMVVLIMLICWTVVLCTDASSSTIHLPTCPSPAQSRRCALLPVLFLDW